MKFLDSRVGDFFIFILCVVVLSGVVYSVEYAYSKITEKQTVEKSRPIHKPFEPVLDLRDEQPINRVLIYKKPYRHCVFKGRKQ